MFHIPFEDGSKMVVAMCPYGAVPGFSVVRCAGLDSLNSRLPCQLGYDPLLLGLGGDHLDLYLPANFFFSAEGEARMDVRRYWQHQCVDCDLFLTCFTCTGL